MNIPELGTFMSWGDSRVAEMAPETVIFAPGGTRRRAALDNIPKSDYTTWAIRELGKSVALFFRMGIRHVFVPMLGPRQLTDPNEEYRNKVVEWIAYQSTSSVLRSLSEEHGYRLRLTGSATRYNQVLHQASALLCERDVSVNQPTLWMYTVQNNEESWNELLEVAVYHNIKKREEIAKVLYGEIIKPVSFYIGFGRFAFHPGLIPPALFSDDIQCYWTTKAGFGVSREAIMRILYDYTYSRSRQDEIRKSRYDHVQGLREYWDKEEIIGLGWNEHGFWMPKTNAEM